MASYTPTPVPTSDFTKDNMYSSMTYHGLNVLVNGSVIGRIQSWNPASRTRTVTHKWELSKDNFGRPVDLIPSKAEGYSITIGRIEVWEAELEIACGYATVWTDLIDQNYPFVFTEQIYHGDTLYRSWDYPACWFTDFGLDAASSDGDGAYLLNATVNHLPRTRTK